MRQATTPVLIDRLIRLVDSRVASLDRTIRSLECDAEDFVIIGERRRSSGELLPAMREKRDGFLRMKSRLAGSKARGCRRVDVPSDLLDALESAEGGRR